jgi:hypothetical protein
MGTKNPKTCLPFSKQNKNFTKWQNSAQTRKTGHHTIPWKPVLGSVGRLLIFFFIIITSYYSVIDFF